MVSTAHSRVLVGSLFNFSSVRAVTIRTWNLADSRYAACSPVRYSTNLVRQAMKRVLLYSLVLSLLFSACAPVYVLRNDRPNRPHDNGKHKGWYKNGRYGGLPPGQAKKQRW